MCFALTLSHLEDLSVNGSTREPENISYLTGEMFSDVCRLFDIHYGKEDFEGSVDDLRVHLYDRFKGDLRCLPPIGNTLM